MRSLPAFSPVLLRFMGRRTALWVNTKSPVIVDEHKPCHRAPLPLSSQHARVPPVLGGMALAAESSMPLML